MCWLSSVSRPPDRRRRDVFGVANSTHWLHNRLPLNNSTVSPVQAGSNSSSSSSGDSVEPVDREFEFTEQSVTERELQISGLKPFTVYRIDIHACNRQVQRCSAAEFVFSRTKPAGEYICARERCLTFSFSVYLGNIFPHRKGRWYTWVSDLGGPWRLGVPALARAPLPQRTRPHVWNQV